MSQVPTANIMCSDCQDITVHELHDYNDRVEVWECTYCGCPVFIDK
jgi:hypothetical protein